MHYTLVQDGAIPEGFLTEFEALMTNVGMDAAIQSWNTHRNDVQSDIWLHEHSKVIRHTSE